VRDGREREKEKEKEKERVFVWSGKRLSRERDAEKTVDWITVYGSK
jgi:hypothetical protein